MQPYRHYHKLLEDQDAVSTIISVAELLRSEAEGEGDAKTSMNSFINMLKNAGLNINYDGLKAYYEAEPRLQGQIQDFNEKEIVFVGDEEGLEMKPQGEVPPEEKVAQMAKSATDKRQSESFTTERYEKGKPALLTFPSNTLVVDTPSDLDWYKIGEFIPGIIAGSQEEPYELGQEDTDVMINFADDKTKEIIKSFLDKQGITYKEIDGIGHPEVHKQDPNVDESDHLVRIRELAGLGEKAPPGREKQVKALKKKFDDPGAPYAIAWAQHNKSGKPKKKS